MLETITSRDNEQVKYVCKLQEKTAFARAEGFFAAEGVKLCLDAADAGLVPECIYYTLRAAERWPRLTELACRQEIVSEQVAAKMSGMKSVQGVVAVFPLPRFSITEIDPAGRYLALENVQDPANVGAVARSAAAFGYSGILLGPGCADLFGPKALRASMGAAFRLPVLQVEDLPALLKKLSAEGMATAAAALQGAQEMSAFRPQGGVVLVVGSEGQGLTEATIHACDVVVKIPIHTMESLNAAVAASILMWEYGGRPNG